MKQRTVLAWAVAGAVLFALSATTASAHPMEGQNAAFVQGVDGPAPGPFMYLGAKHMVTGYDHLLFLVGVIFFLYRLRDVVLYVSLFTIGHSITLLAGVLGGLEVNAYVIDAVIGLSVCYKAFENIGASSVCSRYGRTRESPCWSSGCFTVSGSRQSCRSSP